MALPEPFVGADGAPWSLAMLVVGSAIAESQVVSLRSPGIILAGGVDSVTT
jgi:hypothetical protein